MPFAVLLQYLVPQHLLSRLLGQLAQLKAPWLKNTLIRWFIKRYQVNMSEAEQTEPSAYVNFNHFFTRALRPGTRPITQEPTGVACPADGTISELGIIQSDQLLQAKGRYYSLIDLLGQEPSDARLFHNGHFITVYLSPKDYHRIHMPLAGTLQKMIYIPGRLFSVNPLTSQTVSNLFARNERVICLFTTPVGPMAIILVGAMIVASIKTTWHGLVAPARPSQIQIWNYDNQSIFLDKGEELGQFQLGSTVIVLHSAQQIEWLTTLNPGDSVRMGQLIGHTKNQ